MSPWKSLRNINEKTSPSMEHPVLSSSTFFACWCESGLACCHLPYMAAVSATTTVYLLDRSCGSWGTGLTMSQGTAVSRKPVDFPDHWSQRTLPSTEPSAFNFWSENLKGRAPHTWHKTPPTDFSSAQGGSEGEKLEVKSTFFFWVSQLANQGRIFHLGVKRAKRGDG